MDRKIVISEQVFREIMDPTSERTHFRDAFFDEIERTVSIIEEQNGFIAEISDLDLSFLQDENRNNVRMATGVIVPITMNQ